MQRPFHNGRIFVLAKKNADARVISLTSKQLVSSRNVEIQFANELWHKIHNLQFHHHIAFQPSMIENHVGEVRLATWRVKFHLSTDIRKPFTQFQEEASDICNASSR